MFKKKEKSTLSKINDKTAVVRNDLGNAAYHGAVTGVAAASGYATYKGLLALGSGIGSLSERMSGWAARQQAARAAKAGAKAAAEEL